MSWLFSQALVAEYSAVTCSDGEPFAQLNVMPTPHKFSRNDKTIEHSDLSQFGLTSRLLTEDHGGALLTSFLADFPARTLAELAPAPESKAHEAGFGWKWPASFAKYSPQTSSWKTRQCSLLGDLEPYSETWPRWGSMRDGECLEHITPELPTSEKEFGFWPTIRASDGERGGRGDLIQAVRGNPNRHFKMYSTPVADDTGHRKKRYAQGGTALSMQVGGQLNPTWIEWLMGWPSRWTALEPLETDRFQEWLRQHSPSCLAETEAA
jgi:hypothetical protein